MKREKRTQAEEMIEGQFNIFDVFAGSNNNGYSFQRAVGMKVEIIDEISGQRINEGIIVDFNEKETVVEDYVLKNRYICRSNELRPAFSNYMNEPEE